MRPLRPGSFGGGVPSSAMKRGRRCRGIGGGPSRGGEVGAVVAAVEAEGLAQAGGAGAEVDRAEWLGGSSPAGGVAGAAHHSLAGERREGSEQDRGADSVLAADDVRAVVHAVGEVDVEVARGSEHRPVAVGGTAVAVAGGVARPLVGLDFDDPGGAAAADQDLVEEFRRHVERGAGVEGARKRLQVGDQEGLVARTGTGTQTGPRVARSAPPANQSGRPADGRSDGASSRSVSGPM